MRKYKSKYSTKRKKKYVAGGMYSDNTVASAGQGSVGTTANMVFQESNPAILDAKLQSLQDSKNNAIASSSQIASELEQTDQIAKQNVATAEQESNQKFQAGENIAKQGMETYDKFQKGASMVAANKAKGLAANQAAKSIAGEGFGNVARQKSAEEVSKMLASQAPGAGQTALSIPGAGSMPTYGLPAATPPPMPVPGIVPPAAPAINTVASTATNVGSTVATEGAKTAGRFAGVGGAGAAGTSGLAKFATSGAGIGTIAALAGTGVSMLSDDGDATKSNVGEYSGSILSSAGTGASVGSLLGPVGTAVGAGVGAIYGAAKQYFGTRKAKKAAASEARKKAKKVGKYNEELTSNLASANMQARAGELEQKTYSGYDLGRNVMAKRGGLRMPKYA